MTMACCCPCVNYPCCPSPKSDSHPNAYTRVGFPCAPTSRCCRACCPAPTRPGSPPACGASIKGCGCERRRVCQAECCPTPPCCCLPGPGCYPLRCTEPRNSGFCCPNFCKCPYDPAGTSCSTCITCGY